jgi:hypothetical protein
MAGLSKGVRADTVAYVDVVAAFGCFLQLPEHELDAGLTVIGLGQQPLHIFQKDCPVLARLHLPHHGKERLGIVFVKRR